MNAQTQIQNLIETYRQAVMTKDVEKVMACTPMTSSPSTRSRPCNSRASRPTAHWQECMEMCPGPHIFEFHEDHHRAVPGDRLRALAGQLRRHQRQG
jgi:ketosteroid isomerase-like protein